MQQIVTLSPFQVPFTKVKELPSGVKKALKDFFYRIEVAEDGRIIRYHYPWQSLEYIWLFPRRWGKKAYLLHLTDKMKYNLRDYTNEQWTNYPLEDELHIYTGRKKVNLMIHSLDVAYPEKVMYILVYPYHKINPFWNGDTKKSRCVICLKEMIPKKQWQMVCSPECRNKMFIKERRSKEITKIWLTKNPIYVSPEVSENCLHCGKTLPDKKRSHRKFCNTACRVAYHRKKIKP